VNATERLYKIDNLLRARRVVPLETFLRELGVSRATFKRDLDLMRDRMNAPIVWDRDLGGYRFEEGATVGPKYELPGLWFSSQEALALLTMYQLLESLQPSLLGAHVKPMLARITALLTTGDKSVEEVRHRIRIINFAARRVEPRHFEMVAAAVLERRKLFLIYWNRGRDDVTKREVSPQRLVNYRNNWYLDAWCHLRKGLRNFALDAMREVALLDERAKDVPEADLDEVLKSGYGIFSGKDVQWATLRFSPTIARWVSLEVWHEKQRARFERDGTYVLEVPYSHDRELSMDILKFGPDCEVLAPPALKAAIRDLHRRAAGSDPK
jgi:predicted DNA-binding transcriptional regulator YafY